MNYQMLIDCVPFFSGQYIIMKRPVRGDDGMYSVECKNYKELFGSRTQVWNGTAYKTAGSLRKRDLFMNKWGRIVSEKKHKTAKKEKRLEKAGYYAKKGKFGYVKRATRKSRKTMGGNAGNVAAAPCKSDLSPASI